MRYYGANNFASNSSATFAASGRAWPLRMEQVLDEWSLERLAWHEVRCYLLFSGGSPSGGAADTAFLTLTHVWFFFIFAPQVPLTKFSPKKYPGNKSIIFVQFSLVLCE